MVRPEHTVLRQFFNSYEMKKLTLMLDKIFLQLKESLYIHSSHAYSWTFYLQLKILKTATVKIRIYQKSNWRHFLLEYLVSFISDELINIYLALQSFENLFSIFLN